MTLTVSKETELGVRTIANAVAKGEISPSDVAEETLGRISALDSRVQAWSHLDATKLREDANMLSAESARGQLRGPLHGVPIGVKDEFHVQGMPTGFRDSPIPFPEAVDATLVTRLRAAGAMIVGKTWMPVGGRMPPTHNPWNLEHTAGGSSSGSGAAVGARMVPVAIAEQTGGSCLRPAAYCGVDAIKPTFGRISRFGNYPFSWTLDHPGIIGLSMEDIALVFSVIAGADAKDPTALQEPAPSGNLDGWQSKRPRIGVVRNFFPQRSVPVMNEAIDKSAATLKKAGADVVDIMLPELFGYAWPVHRIIMAAEGANINAKSAVPAPRPAGVNEVDRRAGSSEGGGDRRPASLVPATYYLQAQRIRRMLYGKTQSVFRDVEALLMPVAPAPAPKGLTTTGDASLLGVWSLLGFPAITINGGLSPEGMPLGLQFVAAPKADYRLMQIGAWCENAIGRLPAPPIARG